MMVPCMAGEIEGVFSADAEGLSMSIIMTLIPLFGSMSGRFRGGVQRGRSTALDQAFRAETLSVANPLKIQGVFPA